MRVKMILPALTEAKSPFFRPINYSLFPPLGLATLAGYLRDDDEVALQDEHVEKLDLDDEPDLVVIQVYITSARRAYELADHYRRKGARVALGGLHVTPLPEEAAHHADSIFLGPGEDTWPVFLDDFRAGRPRPLYRSTVRTLDGLPPIRRDLIRRSLYLVPNSIVVSRGCPHLCDFCYKKAFFEGGRGFYTQTVDDALAEIDRLPGRHLYFLDDHLFGNARFASALFEGMRGMGRLWQAAGTVQSVLRPGLLEQAVAAGLRSLFVGFETLNPKNLKAQRKFQNLRRDYGAAVRRLRDLGVMVNGSFVFGMDEDDPSVFERTVEWAIEQGIETATFHILHALPRHRALPAHGGRRPAAPPRLGSLRHAPRRLPHPRHERRRAGVRLLASLPRLLPLGRDPARRVEQGPSRRRVAPLRLHRRVEEARAALGPGHPHSAGAAHAPCSRADPARLRPAGGADRGAQAPRGRRRCRPARAGDRPAGGGVT